MCVCMHTHVYVRVLFHLNLMLRKELDWPALAPSPLPQTQAGQPPIGSNNAAASASSRHPAEAISYSQLAPGKQQTKGESPTADLPPPPSPTPLPYGKGKEF